MEKDRPRGERLEKALRANLARRKAQAREREASDAPKPEPIAAPEPLEESDPR